MIRRVVVGAVLAAGAVGAVVATDDPARIGAAAFGSAEPQVQPVVPAARSLGVTWFCPGAPASAEEPGAIVMANPTDVEVRAVVNLVRAEGDTVQSVETVGARSTLVLNLAERAPSTFTAAMVETRSGSLVVEQRTVTKVASASSPCVTTTSAMWHSADGATSKDALYDLMLFNPYPADAVVDLEFFTEEGRNTEKGIYIPAGSLKVIDLGERGTRRKNEVSVSVSAVAGRVVAGRLLQFDGTGDRSGIVSGPLAPAASTSWVFPDGVMADNSVETVVIYNPNEQCAQVEMQVFPDDVTTVPAQQLITVPPGEAQRVEMFRDDQLAPGAHRIVLTSVNDVAVVAERVIDEAKGVSSTFGSHLAANRWWFVDGNTAASQRERIVVANPTGLPATVTLRELGPGGLKVIAGAENVAVEPGKSMGFDLDQLLPGRSTLTVLVDASGPVIAERTQRVDGAVGGHRVLGLPEAGVPAVSPVVEQNLDLESDLGGDENLPLDTGSVDSGSVDTGSVEGSSPNSGAPGTGGAPSVTAASGSTAAPN
ncbi:MAG: DUF5719 family protein [Acidimicrobiia bacterium]